MHCKETVWITFHASSVQAGLMYGCFLQTCGYK
jgi:hypothetical protein